MASPTKARAFLRGLGRARRALDVLVGDAVHLVAEDRAARVHEGRPAVGDLATLHAHRGDLDEVGHLGVRPGGLHVDDDELRAGLGLRDEVENRLGPGVEEREALGLADGLLQLQLQVDERLERAVGEEDRLGHHVLGEDLRAGLDHHDRVARTGDDQVELAVLELRHRRVDDELTVDAAEADCRDRSLERDLADRQRGRCGDRAEDVGVVLLVGGEDRDDALDVVLVPLREERPDRAVGQAAGEDGGLGRARLALDEAARDLAGRVHPLLEVDREREEIEAGARIRAVGGAEHDGVTVAHGDGATGEPGHAAGLDGQRATTELDGKGMRHELLLARVGAGPRAERG